MSTITLNDNNPHTTVCSMIESAVQTLQLEPTFYQLLAKPMRTLEVSIPVTMDDGKLINYTGYRCQHSDWLGPAKGGIRFHPEVTQPQVCALATWMSLKTAVSGLPFGGGKGGVIVDPKQLSRRELEALSRGYIRAIAPLIGPDRDIPAPDVGTNPQIIGWMADEYYKLHGYSLPAFITGKPIVLGGSVGRIEATGRGVFITITRAAKELNLDLAGATAAIQGFGNVGSIVADYLSRAGVRVVAVSGSRGGIYNKNGLAIDQLIAHTQAGHQLIDFIGTEAISNEELLTLDVDLLIPAALGNQINEQNAPFIRAKIVAEGANGPTTAGGDQILEQRGIFVIPEILSNAGGVIVSYLEWVQNRAGYYWPAERVEQELETKLAESFAHVYNLSIERQISMRKAAYLLAVQRIAEAIRARGVV